MRENLEFQNEKIQDKMSNTPKLNLRLGRSLLIAPVEFPSPKCR